MPYDNAGERLLANIFACFKYLIDYNGDFLVLTWSACCVIITKLCEKGSTYFMDKRRTKRGFTLVELIVVLVILALLAALLVPALTGYIDKARKRQVIAETRMLTQAAQTELSALYGSDEFAKAKTSSLGLVVASKDGSAITASSALVSAQTRYNDMVALAEVPSITNGKGSFLSLQILTAQSAGQFITMVKVILVSSVRTMVQQRHLQKMKFRAMKDIVNTLVKLYV